MNNIKIIKSHLDKNVMLCAMVKANAYSHNAEQISKIINNYVDYLGVANINEAIQLRLNGITNPILCVGALIEPCDYDFASQYNIDVTVCNKLTLLLAEKCSGKLNIHLKLDTGMTRLGFRNEKAVLGAYNKILDKKHLTLKGVFSHFVDSNDRALTDEQFYKFLYNCKNIEPKNVIFHIGNSGSIKYKEYNLNMVRVGLSIYGYGDIKGLKPVLKIVAKVIDLHIIKAGETVGYGACYKAKNKTVIATINIGYADGLDMRYTGCDVKINHKKYKIIGKICMDMCFVLVDDRVKIGDDVVILDNAQELADYSKKSVYEVLSNFKDKRAKIIVI